MIRLLPIAALALLAAIPAPAEAVVYCREVGVPRGCVVRPTAPAVRAATPGLGAPGVGIAPRPGVGAPGVGAPGVGRGGVNLGGPVNRVGPR